MINALRGLHFGNERLKMINEIICSPVFYIDSKSSQLTTANRYKFKSKPKMKTKKSESRVNQTLSALILNSMHQKKVQKAQKDKCQKHDSSIFFVGEFVFSLFCLFFRDFSFSFCGVLRYYFTFIEKKRHS